MAANVFALPVFFICFRECLETSIIVSVLLSFLKQTLGPEWHDGHVYRRLRTQVWWGVGVGIVLCLIVGAGFIGAFYGLNSNSFSATENIWSGVFGILATVIISVLGAALLRVSKMQDKWRRKIARALEKQDVKTKSGPSGKLKRWCQNYAMFLLPLVTVLREGIEAVVFIGGVGLALPATAIPLAVVAGLAAGILVGYIIYRFGTTARLQIFLIVSTCLLYLIAAGLFSKAVWSFEMHRWSQITGGDAAETGVGPGSYNIKSSVWHVNCCSPDFNGGSGWGIFKSLLGWQNSATYGSVLAYNLYWLVVIGAFVVMRFREKNGRWPLQKRAKRAEVDTERPLSHSDESSRADVEDKTGPDAPGTTRVREVTA